MSEKERLGLAWCRLNKGQWDNYLGEKPMNADFSIIMENIESLIGHAETSWAWWRFELHKTREEWLRFYLLEYRR